MSNVIELDIIFNQISKYLNVFNLKNLIKLNKKVYNSNIYYLNNYKNLIYETLKACIYQKNKCIIRNVTCSVYQNYKIDCILHIIDTVNKKKFRLFINRFNINKIIDLTIWNEGNSLWSIPTYTEKKNLVEHFELLQLNNNNVKDLANKLNWIIIVSSTNDELYLKESNNTLVGDLKSWLECIKYVIHFFQSNPTIFKYSKIEIVKSKIIFPQMCPKRFDSLFYKNFKQIVTKLVRNNIDFIETI